MDQTLTEYIVISQNTKLIPNEKSSEGTYTLFANNRVTESFLHGRNL